MNLTFKKYQGTGNDFILIDDRKLTFPLNNVALIKQLCNRRFGIGADGLILLQPHADADFYMKYYNSDGKESSMCGNGGRCISQFASDLHIVKNRAEFFAIDGKHLAMQTKHKDGSALVKLEMIPVEKIEIRNPDTFVLNTGSPHYVKFITEPTDTITLVEKAKVIRYNNEFKENGINVNFVNVTSPENIIVRTYERGVEDETLSCGTGATAAALATAIFNNLPAGYNSIDVCVKGGELCVEFNFDKHLLKFSDVWLQGPAKMVFEGTINC
ncbi:MAG: diaminopimelate epimerase [Bacteroidia bacterium]|nr:diaminopimelate epimerase [Bacteroidia bacterium]